MSANAPHQLDLFTGVLQAYAQSPGSLSNSDLYEKLGQNCGIAPARWSEKKPFGRSGQQQSALKHRVRWYQQSMRHLGLIERDANGRGMWRITPHGKNKLTPAIGKKVLLGFSTRLGVALWAAASSVFPAIDEPITLCLTSPPYPLRVPRAYGGPTAEEYVDWMCTLIEPIAKHLVPGGSICLNISNDIFEPGLPSRSLYRERLVIALCDRLGLHKMDELIWHCPNKPPGPLRWASMSRQQLNVAWEPVYWFTNNPTMCTANNRRVLQEHTERHKQLLQSGGEIRTSSYGDGAYRLTPGAFGGHTEGRIPRNILAFAHNDSDKCAMRMAALARGLPTHGALMPLGLAKFLVEFLTQPDDLVVDPCGGWFTTAKAAQQLGRRWLSTELMGEYVLGGSIGFKDEADFECFGNLDLPGSF